MWVEHGTLVRTSGDRSLVDAVADGLGARPTDARVGDLAERLLAAHATAGRPWPTVALDAATFARHVARKLADEADPAAVLPSLHLTDLYLAAALAQGNAAALRVLERDVFGQLAAVLSRRGVRGDGAEELTQALREHLLVGSVTRPARIREYAGRGSLRSWIIVAAVRMSTRSGERARRDAVVPLASVADPSARKAESAIVVHEYRGRLERACEAALLDLPQRERTLLRLQLVDGATIDQIGRIYGVHRATAARWLAHARELINTHTRHRLADALGVDSAAAAAIAEQVRSRLDVSVARLLQTLSS